MALIQAWLLLVKVNVADDVRRCYMCGGRDKAGHDVSDYHSVWICDFVGMVIVNCTGVCLGTVKG